MKSHEIRYMVPGLLSAAYHEDNIHKKEYFGIEIIYIYTKIIVLIEQLDIHSSDRCAFLCDIFHTGFRRRY